MQDALKQLSNPDFREAAFNFFDVLGYQSSKTFDYEPLSFEEFAQALGGSDAIHPERSHSEKWEKVHLLFQFTEDELGGQSAFPVTADPDEYDAFVFIGLELKGEKHSRTALASIARELNKPFASPVIVLFKHGQAVTLASVARRQHKLQADKHVLQKVSLLKDIQLENTHSAHLRILGELRDAHRGAHNWTEFLRKWNEVLDISELNKRFYSELSNWFFAARNYVEFPDPDENGKERGLIRLITRLIFTWFVKERGLVPDALFQPEQIKTLLKDTKADSDTYYRAVLQNLFFATLNTEMGERRFRDQEGGPNGQKGDYGLSSVFRYENEFQSPEKWLKLVENVPFLNGGLFECLDAEDKKGVRIDGFSDTPSRQAKVPNDLFWGDSWVEDLTEVLDDKKKKAVVVKPLLNLLHAYKFTIDENTPLEEDVALDPELLGKVFENLLASYNPETRTTARKQTGSFYTPREIVNYMVEEALFAYLEPQVEAVEKDGVNALRLLLSETDKHTAAELGYSSAQIQALVEAIQHCTILDPACGSGAFPMGALSKMVSLLKKLDPDNELWLANQLSAVDAALELTGAPQSVIEDAKQRVRDAFNNNDPDYARKLYLIERCLFGVDIQPIALQISKLRFFIALVIDQRIDDKVPNRNIRALPNLETKFVAANTLSFLDASDQKSLLGIGTNKELDAKFEELAEVRRLHISPKNRAKKKWLEKEDERLRGEIKLMMQQDGFGDSIILPIVEWNPYEQNGVAPFFDPEKMFGPELKDGFDIVIGNPPYLRVQSIPSSDVAYYKKHFKSAEKAFDLYALFIERGYELLAPNGTLSFIVPHKFFQAAFGESLRNQLTKARALRQIVRFGHAQVFNEATTYTCILLLSQKERNNFDLIEIERLDHATELFRALRYNEEHPELAHKTFHVPENTEWDFSLSEAAKVMERIKQHPLTLGEITHKIFQGIATSADKLYVLEQRARFNDSQGNEVVRCYSKVDDCEVEIEAALVKPFLMGKDVHRYELPKPRNVVIFPYLISQEAGKKNAKLMSQAWIRKNCPRGWNYLTRHKHALGERERGKMHGNTFYAYIYPKNLTEFASPKIVTPEIALGCQMTLDSEGICYHTTKVYSFIFNGVYEASEKYLLGLLNAKVLWFFITQTGYVLRGGFYTFKTDYLRPFPLPGIPDKEKDKIAYRLFSKHQELVERLVEYQLHLKSDAVNSTLRTLMATGFDRLIDGLIYERYFPEEFENRVTLAEHLTLETLPALPLTDAELEKVFRSHFAPTAETRAILFAMEEIEAIRIIEEASPGRSKENKGEVQYHD